MSPENRLALFDVDGTLTPIRSVWQHLLEAKGRWTPEGADNLDRFVAGEIGYDEFCQLDAQLLAGVSYSELVGIAGGIPLHAGVPELFNGLRARGYRIALISTGLRVLTDIIVQRVPIDVCIANDLATHEGICTGIATLEVGESDKGSRAAELIQRFGSTHTLAIGDGTADAPMFEEADLAIAIGEGSQAAREAAHVHLPRLDASAILDLVDDAIRVERESE
ncbi:phosphoserine phosphatase [Leifsonia sp. EB41]|uniref:HAD family hydrolase n=1 Tax=Leifsonia sp. EB41 TaxID=3156260 RepID=UPI0035174BE0